MKGIKGTKRTKVVPGTMGTKVVPITLRTKVVTGTKVVPETTEKNSSRNDRN